MDGGGLLGYRLALYQSLLNVSCAHGQSGMAIAIQNTPLYGQHIITSIGAPKLSYGVHVYIITF